MPSSFAITVGHQSNIQFTNNTAIDVGGAVYSEMQPAAPCLFMVTDSAAEISFVANHADHGVGHHMYGTSVRSRRCDQQSIEVANKQGKPYCLLQGNESNEYVNFSLDPNQNETRSPISSAPQRVCLCDTIGKPCTVC